MQEIIPYTRSFAFDAQQNTESGEVHVFINFSATGTTDLPDAKPSGRVLMSVQAFEKFADAIAETRTEMKSRLDSLNGGK